MYKNINDSLWVIGVRGTSIYSSGLNPLHSTWDCCYDYFLLCFACLLPPAVPVSQTTSETSIYCLSHSSPSSFSVLWLLLDVDTSLHLQNSESFLLWGFWIATITFSGRLKDEKIARETEIGFGYEVAQKIKILGQSFLLAKRFFWKMEEGSFLLYEDMDIS